MLTCGMGAFSDMAHTQVTIKERVVISPKLPDSTSAPEPGKLRGPGSTRTALSATSTFPITKDGQVLVYYSGAERRHSPIPFTARLVLRRGTSVPPQDESSDLVTDRLPSPTSGPLCSYWVYQYGVPIEPFESFSVSRGDTLVVFYVTDLHPSDGVPDTLFPSSVESTPYGWDVTIGTGAVSCGFGYVYAERISFFIGILEPPNILLGETKYYKTHVEGSKLKIDESPNPPSGGETGVQFAVLRDTLTADNLTRGTKLGVYHEQKNSAGSPLPQHQIRLVGKYWSPDSSYRVLLVASKAGLTPDTMRIQVRAPDTLLTAGQSPAYRRSRNVFDQETNIDSICIALGGRYGIPPQVIKGQMYQEAHKVNRNGSTGFAPTYLFEPFTTQYSLGVLSTSSRFRVKDGDMGTNGVPTTAEHLNVMRTHYPVTPETLWTYVRKYSQLVDSPSVGGWALYGKRIAKGEMDFGAYKSIQKGVYQRIVDTLKKRSGIPLPTPTPDSIFVRARDSLIQYLRDEWRGPSNKGPRGMKNMWAQTRIASSYGLLQMTYRTAVVDAGYDLSQAASIPERLNVDSVGLPICIVHLLTNLRSVLGTNTDTNNWPMGFDQAIRAMVTKWNPHKTDYAQDVMNNAARFLPRRSQ